MLSELQVNGKAHSGGSSKGSKGAGLKPFCCEIFKIGTALGTKFWSPGRPESAIVGHGPQGPWRGPARLPRNPPQRARDRPGWLGQDPWAGSLGRMACSGLSRGGTGRESARSGRPGSAEPLRSIVASAVVAQVHVGRSFGFKRQGPKKCPPNPVARESVLWTSRGAVSGQQGSSETRDREGDALRSLGVDLRDAGCHAGPWVPSLRV